MLRCLDLAATHSVDPLARAEYLAASDRLLTWAAHCVGDDELDVALRAALRDVGQSHTALVASAPPLGDDLPGVIGRVPESRARARDRLHGRAHYVAVPDVFVAGVAAVEALCRAWRGDAPLVLDLRYNQGGPFADYLAALLGVLFTRDAVAQRSGAPVRTLLGGPAYVNVLVNEHTGSGGEQLAAALARHPHVVVLGRRTAGAGTGFHQRWSLGEQRWVVLPQYRLGNSRSLDIENRGVAPHRSFPHDPSAGAAHDDALLDALPLAPPVHSETYHHRNHEVTHLDEGGIHDRVAL